MAKLLWIKEHVKLWMMKHPVVEVFLFFLLAELIFALWICILKFLAPELTWEDLGHIIMDSKHSAFRW